MDADTLERVQEIADRGLQDQLGPKKKELFDEMVVRGMVTMNLQKNATPIPAGTPQQLEDQPAKVANSANPQPSVGSSVPGPVGASVGSSAQQPEMTISSGGIEGLKQQMMENPDFGAGVDAYNQILREQGLLGEFIPKVDNTSGLDQAIPLLDSMKLRAGLSFDDTSMEENSRLEDEFGPEGGNALEGGFFRDGKGTTFVNPEGLTYGGYEDQRAEELRDRPFRLDELGMPSVGDMADISSDAVDIGVPLATSIMSGGSGIPATFGRAWNVLRASGLSKGLEESLEQLAGTNQQSASEVMKNIGWYAVEAGAFELGGSALNSIFRRVLTGPKTTRTKLPAKTLTEIFETIKNGKFGVAFAKLPQNLREEVVKGVTRGLERAKSKKGAVARTVGGVVGGVKEGLKKSITNTKVNFGPVGELKQVASIKKQRLTDDLRSLGGRPKVDRATEAPLLGKLQSFTDFVTGLNKTRQGINAKAILKKKASLEKEVGGGERLVNSKQTLKKAQKKAEQSLKVDKRTDIKMEIKAEEDLLRADSAVDRAIANDVSKLKSEIGDAGNAGMNLQKGLIKAKETFSKRAREIIKGIDALVGNKPVVAMKNTRMAIKEIIEIGIKRKDGTTIQIRGEGKQWLEEVLNKGSGKQTFEDMRAMLTEMTSAAYNPNLVGDITNIHAEAIKRAVFKDMEKAVLGGQKTQRAFREYARFRQWYKYQIKKFDDASVRDLVKDARAGGLEASEIVARIRGVKSVEQVAKIKRALRDPKVWEQVKRETLHSEIAKATNKEGVFSPTSFFKSISDLDGGGRKGAGRVFAAIFDKDSKQIMKLARELSLKNQVFKLPIKDGNKSIQLLSPGDFKNAMLDKLKQVAIKENKFKGEGGLDEVVKAIAKGDDDIAGFFMQTGKRMNIRRAKEYFGETSKEWKAIKFESAKKVLGQIIHFTDDPLERFLAGDKLLNHIKPLKNEIVEMFGPKVYRQWIEFAEMSANVAPKIESKTKGGIIAASSIALHPLQNLGTVGQLNLMGRLFLSGDGLDFFTRGFRSGLGSGMSRKLGTLGIKGSGQTFNTWWNQFTTKTITDNREDFKIDFPDKFNTKDLEEFINIEGN